MPEISIVTATLNRSQLLLRLWSSLVVENVDFEWIVIDDGSNDDTVQVVSSLGDSRIVFEKLDRNQGVNFARNRGVKLSSGAYIVFLDSDDAVVRGALTEAVKKMKSVSETVGVACFACVMADTGKQTSRFIDGAILGEKEIVCDGALRGGENAYIYKKEIFCDFALPSHLRGCEHVFVYGISKKWNFLMVDIPLRIVHRQSDNLSGAPSLIARSKDIAASFELIAKNHSTLLTANPGIKTSFLRKSIYRYGVAGDRSEVIRVAIIAMKTGSIYERSKTLIFSLLSMMPIARFESWRINRINRKLEGRNA